MRIGISKNFKLISAVSGIKRAEVKNETLVMYGKDMRFPIMAEYPDTDRASDALEKLLKKEYLVIPEEYVEMTKKNSAV